MAIGQAAGTIAAVSVRSGAPAAQVLMPRLGKYRTGKSCLYVKRLADVDQDVLRELIASSVRHTRETYPADSG